MTIYRAQKTLYSMLCDDPNGNKIPKRYMDICICIADLLYSTVGTNTGEARCAAVHGVTESRALLGDQMITRNSCTVVKQLYSNKN